MERKGFFGYDSIADIANTLGMTYNWLTLKLSLVTTAMISTFITSYIYNDEKAVYLLMVLFLIDFVTGVAKSIKNSKFSSYKMGRVLPIFVAAMTLLSISWHLSTVSWVYSFLPSIVYTFISSTLLVSFVENLGELGVLDKQLIRAIKERFNFKKLLGKIDKKDEQQS